MNFSDMRLNNDRPVYIQLAAYVKRRIASGEAADGEALPSRREIAAMLGVNPNTVQKAFRLMEEEGFVVTPQNATSCLRVSEAVRAGLQKELREEFIRDFVKGARENGLSLAQTEALIQEYWEG